MPEVYDLAVVGGGVIGLAHATIAARAPITTLPSPITTTPWLAPISNWLMR